MLLLDREAELARLDDLTCTPDGGLAVLSGRRRVGKTRILTEWAKRSSGLYTVADQSAPEIQRAYFAESVAARIPGFADVSYPDWRVLLRSLSTQAKALGWRGPIIFDELPYLAAASPELPSVLQSWLDHEAKAAKLVVAIAGSSQRMMQGLVLSAEAPLFGRARVMLSIEPLDTPWLARAFPGSSGIGLIEAYTVWGGIPRYWELAAAERGSQRSRVERIVLDPLGPLHREPDRILLEEVPSAVELRPVLDAIGSGAHRVSEIAGRIGRPATSMSRPLARLVEMGLVAREIPFGESERKSKRALYKIADPFFRLWFRVVAPHRGFLQSAARADRLALLERFWTALSSAAWEDVCRRRLPRLGSRSALARRGPWGPASRWWHGNRPEWDLVSLSAAGGRLLLGEVKWSDRPCSRSMLERESRRLATKELPHVSQSLDGVEIVRVLFVPARAKGAPSKCNGVLVVDAAAVMR